MGKIVGIDLGTTNSVVAVMEGKDITVITNAEGSRLTPSVVAFTDKGERLVGASARRQAIMNPANTVYSIKRFMGRRRPEVAVEEKMVPYRVVGTGDELVNVEIRGRRHSPPEISAFVLQNLKETAEAYLGEPVKEAVITVPAYFNDSQRQATKDAGRIAGLDVKRIINEPTAAALAYGLDKKTNEKVAIFDLGGGTFDISILDVGDGVVEVLSTNGDTHLGGDDFDQVLINHAADDFNKQHSIDLRKDQMALQRLKEACEKAKCELSSALTTEINLPFVAQVGGEPKHLQMTLTRARFEQLTRHLSDRCLAPARQALTDAKLRPEEVQEVVLVGGSTRIPMVQQAVRELFKKEPNRSVNPDEVVAVGAAIQGAVLTGEVKDILLLDVTPLSLGVETLGGVFTKLIERNTTIPTSKKETFSTASDSQSSVEIHVLQGEREMAGDNRSLGRFSLDGIPPAARGVPQIEVAFDIDANGILKVLAKDLATMKLQQITVKASSGLNERDIDKMVKDAAQYAEQDKKRKKLAEAKNQADQVAYATEKAFQEMGDKIPESERKEVDAAIAAVRKARDGDDPEAIQREIQALEKVTHKYVQQMYEAAAKARGESGGAPAGGPTEGPGPAPDAQPGGAKPRGAGGKGGADDIIDADFEAK